MNYCRTCKYWSLNPNFIGVGYCTNVDVSLHVLKLDGLNTSQNFGCVLHTAGPIEVCIYTESEVLSIRDDFMANHPMMKKS